MASAADFRILARKRLPHFLFEYIDGGAFDEVTLARNAADLANIALRQRVLRDVSSIDLSTRLFEEDFAMPLALAPIGLAGLNARRGECQAARAAEAAGVPFTLSTVSACTIAEVANAVTRPMWFQLYMVRDRGFMRELLRQAGKNRCSVLVFTVDMPVPGTRYRDYRSGLAGAPGFLGNLRRFVQALARPRWAWDVGLRGRPHHLGNVAPLLGRQTGMEDFFAWMRANFDPSATWRDLDFIRSEWTGKLVIKGVLDPDDARSSVSAGADGIVVSNHGGRQLDGTISTAKALPPIVEAIRGSATILVDGGIRSGLDVIRMLALGADAVMFGRPWAYALGAAGERGVAALLKQIEAEMQVALALTGTSSVQDLTSDVTAPQ